jgi:hypothetical protein
MTQSSQQKGKNVKKNAKIFEDFLTLISAQWVETGGVTGEICSKFAELHKLANDVTKPYH